VWLEKKISALAGQIIPRHNKQVRKGSLLDYQAGEYEWEQK